MSDPTEQPGRRVIFVVEDAVYIDAQGRQVIRQVGQQKPDEVRRDPPKK